MDVSGSEGRDPIEDFQAINTELAKFSEELGSRPQIVVANKIDLADEEQIERFRSFVEKAGYAFFTMSAATTEGTRKLVEAIAQKLDTLPPILQYESDPSLYVKPEDGTDRSFEITVERGVYYIDAPFLESILSVADMEDYESLQYFQRVLHTSGIYDKLEELGIEDGNTVDINGFQFEFIH